MMVMLFITLSVWFTSIIIIIFIVIVVAIVIVTLLTSSLAERAGLSRSRRHDHREGLVLAVPPRGALSACACSA
jgi:hypothetical protein